MEDTIEWIQQLQWVQVMEIIPVMILEAIGSVG
jgi:hypothetical protein